jgi:hypothetical protein
MNAALGLRADFFFFAVLVVFAFFVLFDFFAIWPPRKTFAAACRDGPDGSTASTARISKAEP